MAGGWAVPLWAAMGVNRVPAALFPGAVAVPLATPCAAPALLPTAAAAPGAVAGMRRCPSLKASWFRMVRSRDSTSRMEGRSGALWRQQSLRRRARAGGHPAGMGRRYRRGTNRKRAVWREAVLAARSCMLLVGLQEGGRAQCASAPQLTRRSTPTAYMICMGEVISSQATRPVSICSQGPGGRVTGETGVAGELGSAGHDVGAGMMCLLQQGTERNGGASPFAQRTSQTSTA